MTARTDEEVAVAVWCAQCNEPGSTAVIDKYALALVAAGRAEGLREAEQIVGHAEDVRVQHSAVMDLSGIGTPVRGASWRQAILDRIRARLREIEGERK